MPRTYAWWQAAHAWPASLRTLATPRTGMIRGIATIKPVALSAFPARGDDPVLTTT